MAKLSKKLEEKRAKLAQLIERKAFDAYVRHGVVPDDMQRLAETAADDQKFLDLCAGLSTKALPNGRPTTHYTWRTAGDDRVRHTHAALEDHVNSLKAEFASLYNNVLPEVSYDDSGFIVHYGKKGSTRLDVLELLPDERAPNLICDYEVKSGDATMQIGQIRKQGTSLTARYPGAIVMVFQMKPSARNGTAL